MDINMTIAKRLELLRNEMHQKNIDMYIVPSIDAHNSEYVPKCWERRSWISNFDGSAGEALISLEHAYLWTDGRYFAQAEQQLDNKYYSLIKQTGFAAETEVWLSNNAQGKSVAIDPNLISISRALRLQELMEEFGGKLVMLEENLVDSVKHKLGNIDELPKNSAFALDIAYTGETIDSRLRTVQQALAKFNADYIALNVLDEIAWLLNIRGADIDFNPLVICYAIVGTNSVQLFVDKSKISKELIDILKKSNIDIYSYEGFKSALRDLRGTICLDDKTANYEMLSNVKQNAEVIFVRSPIIAAKACKNIVEINGARNAHIKDGVAVISFLSWLDINWQSGVTEVSVDNKLSEFRNQQENLRGASFASISGFGSNGAIIHYRATPETNKIIDNTNMYLIDSGGQYLDGTTDITRTIHLGNPTPIQKRHYTLVLKGHLQLARAKFPKGTCGEHLDVLARAPLWNEYLNYRHGTGHGVGSFLCVHEGPQRISPASSGVALLPGMIVSNEPGFYINGEYGIRIENLCLIREVLDKEAIKSEYGPFYGFEDLTLVPYAKKLIDVDLLSKEDILQIKAYYAQIIEKIRPRLSLNDQAWLDNELNFI